jgi:hypothetical protein
MTSSADSIRPSTLAYAVGREPICAVEASVSVHAAILSAIEGLNQLSYRPDLVSHRPVLVDVRSVLEALAQVMLGDPSSRDLERLKTLAEVASPDAASLEVAPPDVPSTP